MNTNFLQTNTQLKEIGECYSETLDQIEQLEKQIKYLENLPMLNGHEWWKNGKYLYLVHHDTDTKEYIGVDPEKVKEAQERLRRYKQWEAKRRELSNLLDRTNAVDAALIRIENTLRGIGWI
jgi:hypothetical protein